MKEISYDTYLKALGLTTLAQDHNRKARECVDLLEEILDIAEGDRGMSHFSDCAYSDGSETVDDALNKAEYTVAAQPKKDAA